mgnify:CR=1 FL=1|tara:strand:- start:81 stop:401 length:321 start_codon:yes stop_codon:yes gene_type:complete
MAITLTRRSATNSSIYQHEMPYAEAKAIVEHLEGEPVTHIKSAQSADADNAFCLWFFADGTYVTSPAGPSVEAGMSLKDLTFGYDDDMDTFVAYVAPSFDDTREEA